MKTNPILIALCFFMTMIPSAFAQTTESAPAPQTKPDNTKTARTKLTPEQEQYNKAINDFNTATRTNDKALIASDISELQALTLLPDYQNKPVVHNLLGYLYLTQNDPASAVPELQKTVQLSPDDLDARNNLGSALRQTQKYNDAATQYQYILDHPQTTPSGLDTTKVKFNLATALGQAGRLDESLALFAELAAANPDAATMKNYGFFLQKAGKTAEAADALRKAGELNPKDSSVWLSAGELYVKAGNNDQAISALNKALSPDATPLDVDSKYQAEFALGEAYAANGVTTEAITEFQDAATLQPLNATPLYNAGVLQEQANLKADAETSYRSALALDADNLQIQTALGLLLANEGKTAEAAAQLSQTAPKLPQDSNAALIYARLGDLYAKLKQPAKADIAWRQALALNPTDADTEIALAGSYLAQKQYVSALAQFDAAAQARPQDAAIQNGRGTAYQKLRQYPRALAAFQKALALDPTSAQIQNNVGVVYELLGKQPLAIKAYKKALALNPYLREARLNLNRFARH